MIDTCALPTPLAEVAEGAAVFVENRLGEPLPPVDIVVASRLGLARHAVRAAAAVVGGRASWLSRIRYGFAMWREARTGLACTLLDPGGVLVVVTVRALVDEYLPDYLVHELVHAAQFSRPGRRGQLLAELADLLGVAEQSDDERYAAHLRQEAEEGEAYRIQAEHGGVIDVGGMPWRP